MKGTCLCAFLLAFILALGMAPASRAAQGFYIGTGLGFASPQIDDMEFSGRNDAGTIYWDIDGDPDPGQASSLELIHLGYNFSDRWGFGIQWGAFTGDEDNFDDIYGVGYFDLSGRYTHDTGGLSFIPYVELGIGDYTYLWEGDDEVISLAGSGIRLAVGGQYYFDNFYLSPEFSFHSATYTAGQYEADFGSIADDGEYDLDNDVGVRAVMLLFKFGYHWRQ